MGRSKASGVLISFTAITEAAVLSLFRSLFIVKGAEGLAHMRMCEWLHSSLALLQQLVPMNFEMMAAYPKPWILSGRRLL